MNTNRSPFAKLIRSVRDHATHPGVPLGIMCGLVSAVFYTLSNIALRQSVSVDSFLVAAMKSLPTVVFLTPYLMLTKYGGQPIATSRHLIPRFIAVSLLGQIGGNGSFQFALKYLGLAATVPITLGSLLIGSAIVGRIVLGETVERRKMLAIAMLIAAVVLLSQSGQTPAEVPANSQAADWRSWIGAGCAVFAGLSFAIFSSFMRLSLQNGLQSATAMWISGSVGGTALLAIFFARSELTELSRLPAELWIAMAAAGVFNFVAFVAITTAMRVLPIVAVHLLNASQVAMAAVAGVALFDEPLTRMLVLGISLTMAGLSILASRRRPTPPPVSAG